MTDPEKLRALVERLRNVNKHGVRCDECSNTHWMHQEVEAVANELSTLLTEAERPIEQAQVTRLDVIDHRTGVDSKQTAQSPMYWLGGTVETLAEVKARATEKDRILVANMEGNGYDRIITNDNSWRWVQPLNESDVVLQWP
jgi:hypothetical protein